MDKQPRIFFLLGTDGCHLCEVAETLLMQNNIEFQKIDIIEDEQLVSLYGDHIPVFIAENAEQALFWPFEQTQLKQYLIHYGIDSSY
ncbi:glutaredoxin family protein [Psychrosphaera sp. B3R10]|uniref:Glutaredoxin family protein n=1 Tax=Psychrosphaera algicola TaxID=3023714 RepID=A0ABT5F8V4_9GAMM|nr:MULTISPECIES: glutaredoxin family protein [unclassified Psychrosphaera]MBU2882411.1 glutaredoxin family protein [Psychrosphaera sp. I2R16]MBU2989092.1 glutaredoxin family protein [Psychrosphaera sp. B3R10]MDC2887970.1 glutaredoxin family protein [Psychrosphaera sp. G1-22]MDO6718088.1 glutaredoxin family protein [Psychrosphaera sp. 1_MG-2023]